MVLPGVGVPGNADGDQALVGSPPPHTDDTRLQLCGAAPTRHPPARKVIHETMGFGRLTSGPAHAEEKLMHQIIYIVGAVVIVLFILSYIGLR